jgi:hypothetical protein
MRVVDITDPNVYTQLKSTVDHARYACGISPFRLCASAHVSLEEARIHDAVDISAS